VVVLPMEAEQVTASGIVIPDTAKGEKPQEGIVLALGKGGIGKDSPNPSEYLKVGDKVLFGKYAGSDVKLEGEDFLIMREEDILGVIEK
jgi:chaperonin GroES